MSTPGYLYGEQLHIVLSLVTKTLLIKQIFSGKLMPVLTCY